MGSSITVALPNQMLSGQSLNVSNCSAIDSVYSGKIGVTCNKGSLTSNVSGCKVDSNANTEAVEIIQHGIAMEMPIEAGTNLSAMQEAMNHPAALEAIGKSIATGLGLSAADVEILSVTVIQSRRLSMTPSHSGAGDDNIDDVLSSLSKKFFRQRRLTSSAQVSVSYQVQADAATKAGIDSSTLSSRMSGLGDGSSEENQRFTTAFAPNLKEAASQITGGSGSVLTSVASQVETRGVTVTSSEAPKTITVQIVKAPSTSKTDAEDANVNVVITIVAMVLGIGTALVFAAFCHLKLNRRLNEVSRISQAPQGQQIFPEAGDDPGRSPPNLGSESPVAPFPPGGPSPREMNDASSPFRPDLPELATLQPLPISGSASSSSAQPAPPTPWPVSGSASSSSAQHGPQSSGDAQPGLRTTGSTAGTLN